MNLSQLDGLSADQAYHRGKVDGTNFRSQNAGDPGKLKAYADEAERRAKAASNHIYEMFYRGQLDGVQTH